MSEAVRAVALAEANKLKGDGGDPAEVVKAAAIFFTFLTGTTPPVKTSSAAGKEPDAKQEGKPSANTAGASKATSTAKPAAGKTTKPVKETEEQIAAKALEKANKEAAEAGETGPLHTDPIEATAEGVALAVKLLLEGDKRDDAIALLKKYKAASVSSMQKKSEDEIIEFVSAANELLGLGGEPSLD